MAGENQLGTLYPKLSRSITDPKNRIEYIAPFFKKTYFLMRSIFPTVNCRTTTAPSPFPMRISGTESVKANAPRTPSIENVASITSRNKIFDKSDIPVCISDASAFSAFCLNPWVMKKAVDPMTAPNAIIGFIFINDHTRTVRIIETTE